MNCITTLSSLNPVNTTFIRIGLFREQYEYIRHAQCSFGTLRQAVTSISDIQKTIA